MNIAGRPSLVNAPEQGCLNHHAPDPDPGPGPLAVGAAPPDPEFYPAKRRRLSMATQLKGATENERNRAALELHNLEHRELHQQMRAMGAPDWAIGLEQAINNLQNNMNNRFNQIDNSIAVLANDVASVTNDLAIVINGSAANPHHRLRRVRNADGDFPEWFPATRGKLLNLSNAEATELMQFYELVPLDIVGVPLVNRRIKAIAAFIGVRNV